MKDGGVCQEKWEDDRFFKDFKGWKMMDWGVGVFLFDGCWIMNEEYRH